MAPFSASDTGDAQPGTATGPIVAPRGSRRRLFAAAVVAVIIVKVSVVVALTGSDAADTTAAASQATATTSIRQQDLVETETVDGTLGYSDARTVVSSLAGTVTWTPRAGSVVKTNHRLYEIDGRAVYLLDGSYPGYRTLQAGLRGDDVLQLERNLRRLGLDRDGAMNVDGTWDGGTTAAAKRWQARKGMAQDATIDRGRIVFGPGSRRIGEITLPAGAGASGPGAGGGGSGAPSAPGGAAALMTTTSTKRIVAVDLAATRQNLASEGARVTVELPSGDDVAGTITRVGKVAQKRATPQNQDPPATIKIVVKLTRSAGTGLDQAPVDVRLERRRAKDVLTVPVTALLARTGGAFAVEVRDGDRRRIVAVKTGLYTDSDVQIEGEGLRPGLKVSNAEI